MQNVNQGQIVEIRPSYPWERSGNVAYHRLGRKGAGSGESQNHQDCFENGALSVKRSPARVGRTGSGVRERAALQARAAELERDLAARIEQADRDRAAAAEVLPVA